MTAKKYLFAKYLLFITTFESLGTLFFLILISPDPKNAWFLGFSRSRSILIVSCLLIFIGLSWFTVQFFRRTIISRRLISNVDRCFSKSGNLCFAESVGVFGIIVGCWILAQWMLITTDQQVRAYLLRITPLVIFFVLIGIQFLIFIRIRYIQGSKNKWIFLLIVLGGTVIFSWFFVGEYFLSIEFFPEYYVEERFGKTISDWMPYILFQTTFFLQLPFIFNPQAKVPLGKKWNIIFAVITLLSGYFYITATQQHAQDVNTNIARSDQRAYISFTKKVIESKFTYSGFRNQTPGYPYFQAIFCGTKNNETDMFICGKQVNILLSLVALIMIYLLSSRYLSVGYAFTLTLITSFSLFIFKAGYYTVEISYYLVSFIGFVLMCRMLIRPHFWLALGTGFTLGLVYLLKASILPGLLFFVFTFILQNIILFYRYRTNPEEESFDISAIYKRLMNLGVFFLGFIGTIFPYVQESKEIYSHYFYNVNSTFYVWFDTWEDAKQAEDTYHFSEGWPDLPTEQIPGFQKYLRDHKASIIIERFLTGLLQQISYLMNPYGRFNYIILFSFILVIVFLKNRDQGIKFFRHYFSVIVFTVSYITGYILLFAWYTPIAGGPRFAYSLIVPILFSILFVIQTITKDLHLTIGSQQIPQTRLLDAVQVFTIALLMFDAFKVITETLPNGYFGS